MGSRGPIGDSLKLAVHGTSRKRGGKAPAPVDLGSESKPVAPSWLTKEQKLLFNETAAAMDTLGVLHVADTCILSVTAVTHAKYIELAKSEKTPRVERELSKLAALLLTMWRECGLTPVARARLHVGSNIKHEESAFDAFLRAGRRPQPGDPIRQG